MNTSLQGAFPYRAPLGIILAAVLSIVLLPIWYRFTIPELQRFYLGSYIRSGVASFIGSSETTKPIRSVLRHGIPPKPQTYVILFVAPKRPALQKDLNQHRETAVRSVEMYPGDFHAWLKKWIYGGGLWHSFGRLIWGVLLETLILITLGRLWDLARRRDARFGIYIRGTRQVSASEFNRTALR